ncbi:MAG: hypothetical protein GYB31_16910 [Bacteroidetes bacterium]|nr:hypothetical protein [Bacteroidota bacterium]
MMNILLYLSLFSTLLTIPSSPEEVAEDGLHDYHVSKCILNYRSETQSLEISLHFFIDDMELALEDQISEPLFLGTEKESEEAQQLLLEYLDQHLSFSVDRKKVNYDWIGRETTDDLSGIWSYMEVTNFPPPGKLKVRNSLMLDVYSDQKNLVSFNFDESGEVYYLFRSGKKEDVISIPR